MDLNSVKWHAAVHGIAKSQTQLSNQTTTEWADTLPLYLRTRWSPSRLFYPRKTFWTKLKISCDWGWGSWNLWPRTIGGSLLSEAAVNPAKLLRGPGSSVGGSIFRGLSKEKHHCTKHAGDASEPLWVWLLSAPQERVRGCRESRTGASHQPPPALSHPGSAQTLTRAIHQWPWDPQTHGLRVLDTEVG